MEQTESKIFDMSKRKEVCFTCLNILLKKNNIAKDDYLFLKEFAGKDPLRVTKLMIIISEPSIKNLSSILDNRTVNFNNISKETKKEITNLGLKTKKQIIPNENYLAVAENKATNTIIKVLASKHKEHEFDFIGNLEIKMDKALIKLQGIKTTKTSTSKFLDFLMMMWVENGRTDNTIKIHLSEYLKLRGKEYNKNSRKEIRKEINEALNTIENIRITFISERGKEKLNVKLNGGTSGIVRGVIFFNFNKDFIEYLNEIPNQFMYVPNELFKFNDKYNPHSYYLLRKACLHKKMNKLKENENIISITSLLNCCPKFETYKNYTGSNMKQLTERIITPFERDMDIIESFKWNYKNKIPTTFNELQKENIILKWNKYPNREVNTYKKKNHPKNRGGYLGGKGGLSWRKRGVILEV